MRNLLRELRALRAEVVELRAEVAELRARPPVVINYPAEPAPVVLPWTPWNPWPTTITYGINTTVPLEQKYLQIAREWREQRQAETMRA